MLISFSPQRSDETLTVYKVGDTLTINGADYDFSGVIEGSTLPANATDCASLISEVTRVQGVLKLTLLLPHGSEPSNAALFPLPLFNPADGALVLPQ